MSYMRQAKDSRLKKYNALLMWCIQEVAAIGDLSSNFFNRKIKL